MSPDDLSRDWARAVRVGLAEMTFHAAAHSCERLDCCRPRRDRYQPPHWTQFANGNTNTYGHLFRNTDAAAANAIEAAMRTTRAL